MDKLDKIRTLLKRISFKLFDKTFVLYACYDKKYDSRIYLQVKYEDYCRNDGELSTWSGRKWYLSDYMTDDEIVKTAFVAYKAVVDHEVMEAFTVDGKVLFNPHVNFEALLAITDNEVRRA